MTMRKCSALYILPAETHRETFFQQSTVSEQFSHSPIQFSIAFEHSRTVLKKFFNFTEEFFFFRNIAQDFSDLQQSFFIYSSIGRSFEILVFRYANTFPCSLEKRGNFCFP